MSDPVHVPLRIKLAYGAGAIAYGVKDNGFSVFLLIFYNQVVGLPAGQVGLAVMIALIIDAFIDPAVGTLSDRTHTKWGRRHPWLYASALPIALSWLLLWNPPQGSNAFVLGYLVLVAIFVRSMIACYEIPAVAMVPEMTRDYHERTMIIRYRYLFGWIGGLAMLILAYGVLLAPPYGAQSGPLAPAGYANFAIVGAVTMFVSVLGSAIGTHRLLAHPPARRIMTESIGATLKGIAATLSNRAFLMLMLAGLFAYANQGISFALSNYLLGFVWQFGPGDFVTYGMALFAGVFCAFLGVGPINRALGKKHAAALFCIIASSVGTIPYWLRLLDLFPEVGSPWLIPAYLLCTGIATGTGVGIMITGSSMMADVVEASEERTGNREEGLFYAGALFMQKAVSGLGIFLSGLLLSFADFPANAVIGHVPDAVLDRLTLMFSVLTMIFAVLSALVFLRFPFGRAEHEARLAALAVTASGNRG